MVTCGAVLRRILYGKVGAGYAPALAFMTGSTVKSATGPFVRNPKMSDEVAAVAIYRVLKEKLPTITGMTAKEVLNMVTDLEGNGPDEEEYLSPYKDSTKEGAEFRKLDDAVFDGALDGWGRYGNHLSSTNQLTFC